MRKHIVVYRFSENVPPQAIDSIFTLLNDAFHSIPGMSAFSWGKDAGHVPLSRGFTHCFVMDFEDAASYKMYMDHPNHLAVRAKVREWVKSEEDIFEFDYEY